MVGLSSGCVEVEMTSSRALNVGEVPKDESIRRSPLQEGELHILKLKCRQSAVRHEHRSLNDEACHLRMSAQQGRTHQTGEAT